MNNRESHLDKAESLCLSFGIESKHLCLIRTSTAPTPAPPGEKKPFTPIESTVIGHWIEMNDAEGTTVHRRFLHNTLPLNYLVGCTQDDRQTHVPETFDVVVPIIKGDSEVIIYEQSLPGPAQKETRRMEHIKVRLNSCHHDKCAQRA